VDIDQEANLRKNYARQIRYSTPDLVKLGLGGGLYYHIQPSKSDNKKPDLPPVEPIEEESFQEMDDYIKNLNPSKFLFFANNRGRIASHRRQGK